MTSSPAIELKPGQPFCSPEELNRIARQQGLNFAIAQAVVFDGICQAVMLPPELEQGLIQAYLEHEGVTNDEALDRFLAAQGWSQADLLQFATKGERLQRFKQQVFREEVEIHFLQHKLDYDQVEYSLIRVRDEHLAFELHQRLLEGEATFAELAPLYSEGPERDSEGRLGPYPLSQAHEVVAEKLRVSRPGQLWPPFFLVNIWLILRLERWDGARLSADKREEVLSELFDQWLEQRCRQLLAGETPLPLPLHLLSEAA
jgi:hypothetical protein